MDAVQELDRLSQDKNKRLAYQRRLDEVWSYNRILRQIAEKEMALAEKDTVIAEKDTALAEKDTALAEKETVITEMGSALAEKDTEISALRAQLDAATKQKK